MPDQAAQETQVSSEINSQNEEKSKKPMIFILIVIVLLLILAVGIGIFLLTRNKTGDTEEEDSQVSKDQTQTQDLSEDMIFKQETNSLPSWIKNDPQMSQDGPWYDALYVATSEDGLNFSNKKLFLEHSGVANLILTSDNELIATFQYFSFENEEMFDKIAYATSDDYGKTWSEVRNVVIKDVGAGANPCDSTLVELQEGRFRLYFTYQQMGEEYPQLFSAIGDSIDSEFLSEGQQLETDEIILDPAVIYFDGMWHHYTAKHGQSFESGPGSKPIGVHSISEDGLAFELEDEIDIGMSFLGDVIEDDGGLRFYSGSKSAFSEDGYDWTLDEGDRVDGADPGVAELPDGSYIMIYTHVNK
jgi:hypothetical protein